MNKRILLITPYYEPGYMAGGPIRSIVNLVNFFSQEVKFDVFAPNYDLGSDDPFEDILTDKWYKSGNTRVLYSEPKKSHKSFLDILRGDCYYHRIYINSFFHFRFSIVPILLIAFVPKKRKWLVIAPRGEFSSGALLLGRVKKKLYIGLFKFLGLGRGVTWHATTEHEELDIKRQIGSKAKVITAQNISELITPTRPSAIKEKGEVKIVFLSRVSPMKNLLGAIEVLNKVRGGVIFNIYGPNEDKEYWDQCLNLLNKLPANISWSYHGPLLPSRVYEVLSDNHLFFLPTEGENYGHAIVEAFMAGLPVLISDQTPWKGLEKKGVGFELPLSRPDLFVQKIEGLIEVDNAHYLKMSKKAKEFGCSLVDEKALKENYRVLFDL